MKEILKAIVMIPFYALVSLIAIAGMVLTAWFIGMGVYINLTKQGLKRQLKK